MAMAYGVDERSRGGCVGRGRRAAGLGGGGPRGHALSAIAGARLPSLSALGRMPASPSTFSPSGRPSCASLHRLPSSTDRRRSDASWAWGEARASVAYTWADCATRLLIRPHGCRLIRSKTSGADRARLLIREPGAPAPLGSASRQIWRGAVCLRTSTRCAFQC